MVDTGFHVPAEKHNRIAQPQVDPQTGKVAELLDVTQPATFFAGGHGLVSTAGDYLRFAQMLLNGGELDGARILSPRTIAFMASDHVLGSRHRARRQLDSGQRLRLRAGLRGAQGDGPVGMARLGRRVLLGRLRRHLFLDRSEGAARAGVSCRKSPIAASTIA